ncbi:MAG: GGDEF domain-containing protein [Thermoleophilia bacterium]
MTKGQNPRPGQDGRAGRPRRRTLNAAARLKQKNQSIDVYNTNRKLKALTLVCTSFFFLWLALRVFGRAELWPLLAAPILLSAWFFYEVGVIVTVGLTGLLLVQTSFDKSGSVMTAIFTFAFIGLGMAWALRRQRRAHRHILRSSLTDNLTGLYNYGYFMKSLDGEMHRAERYGGAVTLVMFDLDHFKMFNDRFGHQAGNEALKSVAMVLRREKRESDIVARYGGEEFVLLLPGDETAGLETAERMRVAISQIKVSVGGASTTGLTISAGVASYPQAASSREELIDRVDQLLYAAKRAGRNRINVAPHGHQTAIRATRAAGNR